MAHHVGFEGANTIYQAPKGAKDVGDLECFKTDSEVISCWRLSEDEIAQIIETGVVWLSIKGHTVAPVYVSGNPLVMIGDRPAKAEPILPKRKRRDE